MGAIRQTGLKIRPSSIQIRFQYQGRRYEETVKMKPTQANIRAAARMRQDILREIALGQFSFSNWFPDSKHATAENAASGTFAQVATDYLESLTLADSTIQEYRKLMKRYWIPILGDSLIRDLRYSTLIKSVNGIPWRTAKTRNNAIVPLKGAFRFALQDLLIEHNPADSITNIRHMKPDPDPFSLSEINKITAWLYESTHETEANLIDFAFWSGLRSSELSALLWSDVDWNKGVVKVQRSRERSGGGVKPPKTYQVREVELNSRSREALQRQRRWTELQNKEVFLNPNTGEHYMTNKSVRTFFAKALKRLGIRHRPPYHTRHSFCTLALTSGANVMWVSRQMGHSSTQMTLTRYSAWIGGLSPNSESSKLDALSGMGISEEAALNQ